MYDTITFLQNAWSPRWAGRHWPRQRWLGALRRSHSGRRLSDMLDDLSICWNLTTTVCATPEEIPEPDVPYIRTIIAQQSPKLIVACGRVAEETLQELWLGPLLVVPHPTYRMLTKQLYREAKHIIEHGFDKRAALRQRKGRTEMELL